MKTILLPAFYAISVLALSTTFVACEEKGPMEETGERIDETVEEVTE